MDTPYLCGSMATGLYLPRTKVMNPRKPAGSSTRSTMRQTASAVSGVFSDGFQRTTSPQTAARNAFHAHTATGKLKALMTPTVPSGCHCSVMRWRGRSLCIERP